MNEGDDNDGNHVVDGDDYVGDSNTDAGDDAGDSNIDAGDDAGDSNTDAGDDAGDNVVDSNNNGINDDDYACDCNFGDCAVDDDDEDDDGSNFRNDYTSYVQQQSQDCTISSCNLSLLNSEFTDEYDVLLKSKHKIDKFLKVLAKCSLIKLCIFNYKF